MADKRADSIEDEANGTEAGTRAGFVAVISGKAAARLQQITPEGLVARVDLSLTEEPPLAQAFVVISAEAPGMREKRGE